MSCPYYEIWTESKKLGEIDAYRGSVLFQGMKCCKVDRGFGFGSVYFYPEATELRQRLEALKAPVTPIFAELRKRIAVLEPPLIPIVAELRQRLEAAEASLIPIITDLNELGGLPRLVPDLRAFVDCYEKAFADKTEWKPKYRRLFEEEDKGLVTVGFEPPYEVDDPSSEAVQHLIQQGYKYSKVPTRMDREPDIYFFD